MVQFVHSREQLLVVRPVHRQARGQMDKRLHSRHCILCDEWKPGDVHRFSSVVRSTLVANVQATHTYAHMVVFDLLITGKGRLSTRNHSFWESENRRPNF